MERSSCGHRQDGNVAVGEIDNLARLGLLLVSEIRVDRCPPNIQCEYGNPHRAGTPEGTDDVDGIETGYRLRSSYGVGYAVRG